MNKYVLVVILLCISMGLYSQTYTLIDSTDWAGDGPGATSGISVGLSALPGMWTATPAPGTDSDGNGFFGVSGNVLRIEDMEGTEDGCLCEDGTPNCGRNDNNLTIPSWAAFGYCEVRVTFTVTAIGGLDCGPTPENVTATACPSDMGAAWNGTDAMIINAANFSGTDFDSYSICGTNGTGQVELNLSMEETDFLLLDILVGTQDAGEAYEISNIKYEGVLRVIPIINLITNTPTPVGFNTYCENNGNPLVIQSTVSPSLTNSIQWFDPDNNLIPGENGAALIFPFGDYDPSMSGTYRMEVIDSANCSVGDMIDVTILPASDGLCRPRAVTDIFDPTCSDAILPSVDLNGVPGTWFPSDTVAAFAGDTIDFVFTPFDSIFVPDTTRVLIFDITDNNPPALQPDDIPTFCNADTGVANLLEVFSLNLDYTLQVTGDLGLFDAISSNQVNDVPGEYENFSFNGIEPNIYGFFIEGIAPCSGSPVIDVPVQVRVVAPDTRIIIDSLCAGDFIIDTLTNTMIFGDTAVVSGLGGNCDTIFKATIFPLEPQVSTTLHPGGDLVASCGDVIFYYDTLIGGVDGIFIDGPLDNPPLGPDFDQVFTQSFMDTFLLAYPASNGCDSLTLVDLQIGAVDSTENIFSICEFQDTTINIDGIDYFLDINNPDTIVTVIDAMTGDCEVITVEAQYEFVQKDTIQDLLCSSQDTTIEGELFTFARRSAVLTIDDGNFCPRLVVVDLTFDEPEIEEIDTTLCPGESIVFDGIVFNTPVTNISIPLDNTPASDGCDSIVTLTLRYSDAPINETFQDTICLGESTDFLGETYDIDRSSGMDTILNSNGCDSIIYSIDISFFPDPDMMIIPDTTVCMGGSVFYPEYNVTLTSDRPMLDTTIVTANGCNQTLVFNAMISPVKDTMIMDTICAGESYILGSQVLTMSGSVVEPFTTVDGCDSMVTLDLFVLPVKDTTFTMNLCAGGEFQFGTQVISGPGVYNETFMGLTADGCDSTVNLTIVLDAPITEFATESICVGDVFDFNGAMLDSAGIYVDTFSSGPLGCDSIVTLDLTVQETIQFSFADTSCTGQYIFGSTGQVITVGGIYRDTVPSSSGCDSITTVDLTFGTPTDTTLTLNLCAGGAFMFGSQLISDPGVYNETFSGLTSTGCDSMVTLTIVIDAPITEFATESICVGDVFDFNGAMLDSAGIYVDTFSSGPLGCDSIVTLDLRVQEAIQFSFSDTSCTGQYIFGSTGQVITVGGIYRDTVPSSSGCDSITTVDLTFGTPTDTTLTLNLCAGGAFMFGSQLISDPGVYNETFSGLTSTGCDSMVTLTIVIDAPITEFATESICVGDVFDFNGAMLDSAGIYVDTFSSGPLGCDSIVTLDLTVQELIEFNFSDTSCTDQYIFGSTGQVISEAGIYRDTVPTASGCDSITIVDLIFGTPKDTTVTLNLCAGGEFMFGSQVISGPGVYNETFSGLTSTGCDSTVNLTIVIDAPITDFATESICVGDVFDFNGAMLDSTGIYVDTFSSGALGCDSIVTLDLTVLEAVEFNFNDTSCTDQYIFGSTGQVITQPGTYRDTVQSANGCDSITTIDLTFGTPKDTTLTLNLCSGGEFIFGSQVISGPGVYNETFNGLTSEGCDSTVNLTIVIDAPITEFATESICEGDVFDFNGAMLIDAGTYVDTFSSGPLGCDSIVTLDLTVQETIQFSFADTSCTGQYIFGSTGQVITVEGIYRDTVPSASGCDSITTVDLIFGTPKDTTVTLNLCAGGEFVFGSQVISGPGVYNETFSGLTSTGCDSTVNLTIVIDAPITDFATESICDGDAYDFNGALLTSAGIYVDTFSSGPLGCDSIVTLELLISDVIEFRFSDVSCTDQYIFGSTGQVITQPGIYRDTVQSANGCDSITTIDLTFGTPKDTTLTLNLCSGGELIFGSQVISGPGVYNETFNGLTSEGCDSTVNLTIVIDAPITEFASESICSGDIFDFNGVMLNTAGIYVDTFSSGPLGCDSIVTLELLVSDVIEFSFSDVSCTDQYIFGSTGQVITEPGTYRDTVISSNGCDSITTVDLTFGTPKDTTVTLNLCAGGEFVFGSQVINGPGVYNETFSGLTSDGCDSTVNLTIIIDAPITEFATESICEGDVFDFNGAMLIDAGTYVDTFSSGPLGCDSIVTLDLTVQETIQFSFADTSCTGQYIFGSTGQVITFGGIYRDTVPSSSGCDSITTVDLTFGTPTDTTLTLNLCAGGAFMFGSQLISDPGVYNETFSGLTSAGCDSTVTLTVVIDAPITNMVTENICLGDTYNFNGNILNVGGTYVDTLSSGPLGCDSIVTLELVISNVIEFDFSDISCTDQYIFGSTGQVITEPGTYRDTVLSASGCDSISILDLTFGTPKDTIVTMNLCSGAEFVFGSQTISAPGEYSEIFTGLASTGCDSTVNLTIVLDPPIIELIEESICPGEDYNFNGTTLNNVGTYFDTLTTSMGCDSILQLNLTTLVPDTTNVDPVLCPGESITVLGNVINNIVSRLTTERLTQVFTASNGGVCIDTVVALDAILVATGPFIINTSICNGEELIIGSNNEFMHNMSGSYTDTLTGLFNCDSIVIVNLTVLGEDTIPVNRMLCEGGTFEIGDTSFTEAGTFIVNIPTMGGCDSIVELNLTLETEIINTLPVQEICDGESVTVNGNDYSETGIFRDTLVSSLGCDSIVITDLVVVEATDTMITSAICSGESLQVFGMTFNQTGVQTFTIPSMSGCDSLNVTLDLTVRTEIIPQSVLRSICRGDSFVFGDSVITDAGRYEGNFATQSGCDSTVFLLLEIIEPFVRTIDQNLVCAGAFTIAGTTFTETTSRIDTFPASNGCDSIVMIDIVIPDSIITEIDTTLCEGQTISIIGQVISEPGINDVFLTSRTGCDSIVRVNLSFDGIMGGPVQTTMTDTICAGDSITVFDQTFDQTIQEIFTFTTDSGCDSAIVNYNLVVLDEINTVVNQALCPGESFTVGTSVYTTAGNFEDVLMASTGCDSTVRTTITLIDASLGFTNAQICPGTTYPFGGEELSIAGTYFDTLQLASGCDSIVELTLTIINQIETDINRIICNGETFPWQGLELDTSGIYVDTLMSAQDCDSVVTLDLTVLEELIISTTDIVGSCEGVANGSFLIEGIPDATPPFSVTGLDGITTINSLPFRVTGLDTRTYIYNLTDMNGCTVGDSVTITSESSGTLSIDTIVINAAGEYRLFVDYDGVISSIQWDNIPGLSCYDCPDPFVVITDLTTFTVTVFDEDGCPSTASITLDADPFSDFYTGNAFDPESDMNDRFYISSENSSMAQYDMRIYDRWGNLVYEVTDARVNESESGWNGTYKGNDLDPGVFVFSAVIRENGSQMVLNGDVLLVR